VASRSLLRARPPSAVEDPWQGTALDIYRSGVSGVFREVRAILAPHGLLLTDLKALHHLGEGPVHPTALAAKLDVTPAAATQLIDRLEHRRLVRRTPDPDDRRATVVRLAPEGARLYALTSREVHALLVEIVSAMTPEALAALRRGSEELGRVLAARSGR
jgi:DNA-binding MarR family transcriptional regulator